MSGARNYVFIVSLSHINNITIQIIIKKEIKFLIDTNNTIYYTHLILSIKLIWQCPSIIPLSHLSNRISLR
jgi:hypothetical protein